MCFNLFKKKNKQNETPLWQPESQMPELKAQQAAPVQQPQQSAPAASANYNFKLTIEDCRRNAPEEHREIFEPTEADFKEALANNKLSPKNFFVLESATPIKSCSVLQCAGYYGEDDIFDAEIVRAEPGRGEPALKAYHCDLSESALLATMQAFVQGQVPDLDGGSAWYFMMDL